MPSRLVATLVLADGAIVIADALILLRLIYYAAYNKIVKSVKSEYQRGYREYWRAMAIAVVSGEQECALKDETCIGSLQINHLDREQGYLDRRRYGSVGFYRIIALGKRPTDDLNLLCASHNVRDGYDTN